MATDNEPMSDEHLDEIDELLHNNEQVPSDLVRLLANEVERLRAENTAMRAIVERITFAIAQVGNGHCEHCRGQREMQFSSRLQKYILTADYQHEADCPIVLARAFVAAHPTAESKE